MTSIVHHSAQLVAGRHAPATKPAPVPPAYPPPGILSVSPACEDHTAVRQSCSGMPCWIQTAESCDTAFRRLSDGRISIVVCESDLPDGTWRDILERLGGSPERPFLIVTSRVADERLWAEVLNLGGYDVLAKPFNARETRHVLETACWGKRHANRAPQRVMVR
jgi:DNA-binding response OmpR family regulator